MAAEARAEQTLEFLSIEWIFSVTPGLRFDMGYGPDFVWLGGRMDDGNAGLFF